MYLFQGTQVNPKGLHEIMQMKDLVHWLKHNKDSTGCLSSTTDFITDHLHSSVQVSSYLWASVSSLVNSTLSHWIIEWFSMKSNIWSIQSNTWHPARTKKIFTTITMILIPTPFPYAQLSLLQMGEFTTSHITVIRMSAWKVFLKVSSSAWPSSPPPKYTWLFWLKKHHISGGIWGLRLRAALELLEMFPPCYKQGYGVTLVRSTAQV